MDIVYKEEVFLFNETSKEKIFEGIDGLYSFNKMIQDVLIPLAEYEEWIEKLFDSLDENWLLWGEDESDRKIALQDNKLIITLSQWDEITKQIQSLYN
jgi:hypothetical protein